MPVYAQVTDLDLELGVFQPLGRESGHLRQGEALGDEDGREERGAPIARYGLLQLFARAPQDSGREVDALGHVGAQTSIEQQIIARDVIHQQPLIPVEDEASRGVNRDLVEPVVFGQLPVVAAPNDLHKPIARPD